MSQPNWQPLIATLRDDAKPRARRRAIRQLAATRDPAVIPFLRNAFYQDEDAGVREAARQALAQFRAQREGAGRAGAGRVQRLLNALVVALVVVFAVSVGLNIWGLIKADEDDVDAWRRQPPTERALLVTTIQDRYSDAQTLDRNLRGALARYDETGQPVCPLTYPMPRPLQLARIDNYTYPDLEIVAANFDAVLPSLQAAMVLLDSACADPNLQTQRVLDAARKLDGVEAQLDEVDSLLRQAIERPAATVGPTPTFRPTWTHTPIPPTATTPPTATPEPTLTFTPGPSPTATVPPTSTPVPTATQSPTQVPSATPPLRRPVLDYASILRQLSARFRVIGDLQNPYGTGLIDRWQEAASQGQSSTTCRLDTWPEPYALSAQDQAKLASGMVADPQLIEAIRLQQEGLATAVQARALFERDCPVGALAGSAGQGIALAQSALDALTQAKQITDAIRARP